jgi:hypothetical protein
MKLRHGLAALACILAVALFAGSSFGGTVTWTDVTSSIAITQTGAPFVSSFGSDNLWATSLTFANTGTQALSDVQFVNTEAWVCINDTCAGNGPDNADAMTWNNALQEWQLLDGNGDVLATVAAEDSDFALSLDPTSTNIPIPSGFGLSTSDSVPAFSAGDLSAGGSANNIIDFLISKDVTTFFFNGSEVAATPTTAPEPATSALLAIGLLPLFYLSRKRLAAK